MNSLSNVFKSLWGVMDITIAMDHIIISQCLCILYYMFRAITSTMFAETDLFKVYSFIGLVSKTTLRIFPIFCTSVEDNKAYCLS